MPVVMANACFFGWSLSSDVVASFLDQSRLRFKPARIRSNQFSRSSVGFVKEQHQAVVRSLERPESLRVESPRGFDGPSFELMTIGAWNFQELVWRLPIEDFDFWEIYSVVFNLPGFNALLASDPVDVQWQGEESIEAFEQEGRDHGHLGKIEDLDFGGKKIDISQNYGRRSLFPGFWLQAPWKGCFSPSSLAVFGKEKLLELTDVQEIKELDDGTVYVQLFDDVFSAGLPENRARQKRFRELLGLDLLETESLSEASRQGDPAVEIDEGGFEHGGVRLIRRWLDADGRPTRRSNAKRSEEVELDQQGRVVWRSTR